MYGLKQAAVLAYTQLIKNLAPFGYKPCPYTSGLWTHDTRKTKFCLCVDDFGIKYHTRDDAHHLLQALRKHYTISEDWTGSNYCGLTIDWEYDKGRVDISIPDYVPIALKRLQHTLPTKPQHAPHKWTQVAYGQKTQMAPVDLTPRLDKEGILYVQSCVGSFLYYARAVDPTMLVALNEIGSQQSKATQNTLAKL